MGSLDEAIREHLELKRAHGAAEEEVRRKEQEALGPARREAAPAQEPEASEQPEVAPAEAVQPKPVVEEVAAPDASSLSPEPEIPPVAETAPAEPDSSEWAAIDEPFADPPPAPEPAPEPPAAEPDRPSSGNTPTQGFDALSDEGKDAEDAEDVLEETPEFLQDTPEHDKLWFEQKPPRDFDFDDK